MLTHRCLLVGAQQRGAEVLACIRAHGCARVMRGLIPGRVKEMTATL